MENDEGKDFFLDGHRFTAGRRAFSLDDMAENLHCADEPRGLPGAPAQGRPGRPGRPGVGCFTGSPRNELTRRR